MRERAVRLPRDPFSLSLSVSLRDVRCDGADRTRWIDQRSRSRRGTRTGSGSAMADSRDGDTRYTGDVGHLVFAATVQLARLIRFRRDFAAEASEEGSAICAGNLRVARSSLVPRLCSSTVRRAVTVSFRLSRTWDASTWVLPVVDSSVSVSDGSCSVCSLLYG